MKIGIAIGLGLNLITSVSMTVSGQEADETGSATMQSYPGEVPNLVDFWDAEKGVTLVSSAVSAWAGQKGVHTLAQTTAGSRPTVATDDVNGLDAISFDGVDDWLLKTFTFPEPHTIIFVMSIVTAGVGNVHDVPYSGGNGQTAISTDTTTHYYIYDGGLITVGAGNDPSIGVYRVMSHVFSLAVLKIRFNSVQKATGAGGGNAAGGLSFGAMSDGSRSCKVKISDIFVFSSALSDGDMTKVEAYLNKKCALGF